MVPAALHKQLQEKAAIHQEEGHHTGRPNNRPKMAPTTAPDRKSPVTMAPQKGPNPPPHRSAPTSRSRKLNR